VMVQIKIDDIKKNETAGSNNTGRDRSLGHGDESYVLLPVRIFLFR
jgi:hypothetical protein